MTRLTLKDLQVLIQNEEEGTELEFKRIEKLCKDQAVAICKTVSAFANSNGGKLIFGVNANLIPKELDGGINLDDWKQQNGQEPELWLRQMFSTKIHRNISPPDIYYLDHPEKTGNKIMIVDIAQSFIGAHQLKEESNRFAYYYRNGSENRQMEDWQIRDIMNRQSGPDLELFISAYNFPKNRLENLDFFLEFGIKNKSLNPTHTAKVIFWLDEKLELGFERNYVTKQLDDEMVNIGGAQRKMSKYWTFYEDKVPIYGEHVFGLFENISANTLRLKVKDKFSRNCIQAFIKWEIESPGMSKKSGIVEIKTNSSEENLQDALVSTKVLDDITDKSREVLLEKG